MPEVAKLTLAPLGCRWRPTTAGDFSQRPDRVYKSAWEAVHGGCAYWELVTLTGQPWLGPATPIQETVPKLVALPKKLDGAGGVPKTQENATIDPAASPAWSGDSSQWSQEKKLQSLQPDFRGKIRMVLALLQAQGYQPRIVFGWRSVAVQQRLLAEGKSTVSFSFHNAQTPDGTPNSYAVDIIDSRWAWADAAEENGFWEALDKAGKVLHLEWGGDWTGFRDVAHLQGRRNDELVVVKRECGL